MASAIFAFDLVDRFPLRWMTLFAGISLVAILLGRVVVKFTLGRLIRSLAIGRSVVVLGKGEQGRQFLQRFRAARPHFAAVIGVYDVADNPSETEIEGYPFIGGLDDLLAHARTHRIDDIVVTLPWNENYRVVELVDKLYELPVNVYLGADLVGFDLAFRPAIGAFENLPMFLVQDRPISGWGAFLKSVEDYVIASIILVMIAPVMLAIAVAIKLDSKGPVFFKQKRLGFNNKEFVIYKFRSMYHAQAPEIDVKQASKGDPRVTRVGRFIRATSLDELPQFLNVLNGTMSIVGPRPHALSHNEEYGRRIRKYFARHRVKPGITGWAQVNGLRGETEALELMEARIRHDIFYADNWSLMFDIRIIIMTLATVLFHKSAY